MGSLRFWRLFSKTVQSLQRPCVSRAQGAPVALECLESRTLLSGTAATAQLNLVSTNDTPSPVYNYDITLTNTGTTPIATFWLAWLPPSADFLPSIPTLASSPANWSLTLTGAHSSQDGSAIQWIASADAAVTPGQSLSGFDFSSPDGPGLLAGLSPTHTSQSILTSTVYPGAPEVDPGYQFIVADTAAGPAPTVASKTTLAASATTVNLGDPVSFTATVAPAVPGGAVPTGSVTFKDGDTPLGVFPLESNGTAILNTSSLSTGSHSITASYAGDSTYIASISSPPLAVTVSSNPGGGGAPANLVPEVVSSTLPESVVGGVALHGVVSLVIANSSVSSFAGPLTIDLYASRSGQIDNSAQLVTEVTRKLSLAPNQTANVKIAVKSLPDALSNGFYTLLAQAIDPATSNANVSTTGVSIDVASPFVALSESFKTLTLPSAVLGGSKSKAAATLSITNSGNVTTSSSTRIDLFATTDGQIDSTSTLITGVIKSLHIKPGKTVTVKVPLKAIPTVSDGSYLIVARVTDQAEQVSAIASDTPVEIAAPFVTLSASLSGITPVTLLSGKSGTVTLTLTNGGNVVAAGAAVIDLSLSSDGEDSIASLLNVSRSLTIKPGGSKVLKLRFELSPTQAPGTFVLRAVIAQGLHGTSAMSTALDIVQ